MFIDEIKFLVQIKSSVPKEVFAEQILASSIVDQMYLPLFEKNEIGILVICEKATRFVSSRGIFLFMSPLFSSGSSYKCCIYLTSK